MNTPSFISDAILYHDYRRRDALDLSNGGNDGTITDATFNSKGISCCDGTSNVIVAHNVNQQITEGTFVFYFPNGLMKESANVQRLIEKDSGVDFGLYLAANLSGITFVCTGSTPLRAVNLQGKKFIAVTFKTGEIPKNYLDGVFDSNFSDIVTIGTSTDNITLFNRAIDNRPNCNICSNAMIFNRQLTASEISELYGYLANIVYPSKVTAKTKLVDPQLLVDGDMEASDTSAWTSGNAILSKETSAPYAGTRWLKVLYNGTINPCAYQTILTVGKEYRITGWGRGDGTAKPFIYQTGVGTIWLGSTSATWQYFDERFIASETICKLYAATSTAATFTGFDNVSVQEVGANDWKTDWAANVSDAAVSSGFLENTDWVINTGSHEISTDTINGVDVKVIETTSDGDYSIKTSLFGQTPTEAASGKWEYWFKKGASNVMNLMFIASENGRDNATSQDGYLLQFASTEIVTVYKITNGSNAGTLMQTSAGAFNSFQWHKLTIERTGAGVTTIKIDDTSLTASSGNNPFTDNTYTVSNFVDFNNDNGDKIALSDITGNYSIYKSLL